MHLGTEGSGLFVWVLFVSVKEWPHGWQAFHRQHSTAEFSTEIWKDYESILLLFTKILLNSSKEKSPEVVSIKMLTSEK